jgi:predicted phage tail protein
MNRKVYLIGEIGKRFGSEFSMNVNSYANIINCIDCNRPGFREYLLECHNEGIEFAINFAGNDIGEEDLLTPIKEGDVTITAVPAGSKSDGMKIVTGAVLMIISLSMGNVDGVLRGIQLMTMSIGVSLTMQGIQGMLAPDPATDEDEDEGYLYSGDTNIIIEGDPVPLLYGELRIPGQPISVAVNNSATGGGLSPVEEHATVHAVVGNYQNTTITQIFNPQEQDVFLGEAMGGDYWNPDQ